MNKHLIWAITIFSIVLMICGTLVYLNNNAWTVRFEMDENTRSAIESIEYPIMDDIGNANYWYNNGTGRPYDALQKDSEVIHG